LQLLVCVCDLTNRWEQFAPELWQALADPLAYAAAQSSAASSAAEDSSEPPEVGAEEFDMLLLQLQRRLTPLAASEAADTAVLSTDAPSSTAAMRRYYIACYREGQREVLRDAIEALQSMLLGCVEEGDEEDIDSDQ
jgi:hypothetical protein